MTAWKVYPDVENEILNIHGLNNKMSFYSDFRAAYANHQLNSIAVQDDLDDNTYEFVRRYFAMTSWTGGILPFPYDPRHLILRRALSPITGTTDIQASITTLQLGLHQRLQTKRGPEGKRRIVDWMTLDLSGTYFPDAQRDNFGKPWGQTMYNYQWFVGDRTSIISYGWFDFWHLDREPGPEQLQRAGIQPQGPQRDHDRDLAEPPPSRQHLPGLHRDQHRADPDLGPQHIDLLLAEPEMVRVVLDLV